MRKWLIAAGVAVLSLALASVALAQFSQTAVVTLTAHKAGQSTGIKSSLVSADPEAPGAKPKAAKTVIITFPAKTKFNLSTPLVKDCTVSNTALQVPGGTTCPKSSQIGTGSVLVNLTPILPTPVAGKVYAYVRNSKTIILVVTTAVSNPSVIPMTVTGSKLTIPVPVQVEGGIAIVLTSLKLNVPAIGTGKKALMTAGKCAAHKFTVATHILYADNSTFDNTTSSACS